MEVDSVAVGTRWNVGLNTSVSLVRLVHLCQKIVDVNALALVIVVCC